MKILIADDSGFVRNIIIKNLKSTMNDLEFIICADGQEAFNQFQIEKPDLVITDLLMPEMTGQDFLRLAKKENPELKAVVVSADIQSATREELFEIGILDFVNKPLTPDKLTYLLDLVRGQINA